MAISLTASDSLSSSPVDGVEIVSNTFVNFKDHVELVENPNTYIGEFIFLHNTGVAARRSIDAGQDIGESFEGEAPDLGANEATRS